MDQDAREGTGPVTRGQNVVYVMPHDRPFMATFLGPILERLDENATGVQLLVVTPDADTATELTALAVRAEDDARGEQPIHLVAAAAAPRFVAATAAPRAARLLRTHPARAVIGSAPVLLQLLQSATLKLDQVKQVALAWADELLAAGEMKSVETLMAEVPKDAARTVVVGALTPDVEALLERYARRARRVAPATDASPAPVPIEYVTSSARGRVTALRRVLDLVDPESAVVFAQASESVRDATVLLRSLGYADDDAVRVATTAPAGNALTILYDVPTSRAELDDATSNSARTIALVQPRQLAGLRTLAAGGAVKPLALPDAATKARDADSKARDGLRAILARGGYSRALLALEPLLDEYDGSEIAAAALTLLEQEREAHKTALAALPAATRREASGPPARLFITVGSRDGARASDIVGALANQGGVSSAEIGKVDVRESHSIVEVSAGVAETLIEKVTGTTIKGRRAIVRRDEQPERGERREHRERDDRGPRPPRREGARGRDDERRPRGPRAPRDGFRGREK